MSAPRQTPAEFARAIVSGESDERLQARALQFYREDFESTVCSLVANVYPRDDVPADCLVEVQGVLFSFAPAVQRAIDGGVLDTSDQGLVLKDKAGGTVMPPTMRLPDVDA